jgi:hypothetical protein
LEEFWIDTQMCENDTFACRFLNMFSENTPECDFNTQNVFSTCSVIVTHMIVITTCKSVIYARRARFPYVISTRRVLLHHVWLWHAQMWFQHVRVWFIHAEWYFQKKFDFDTKESTFETKEYDFYKQSVIFTHWVWFPHTRE